MDAALVSFRERFYQFHEYAETWGFLYNIYTLPEKNELLKHCKDLQIKLSTDSDHQADINGLKLCDELINIRPFLNTAETQKNKNISPINVLKFINQHNVQDLYPNV